MIETDTDTPYLGRLLAGIWLASWWIASALFCLLFMVIPVLMITVLFQYGLPQGRLVAGPLRLTNEHIDGMDTIFGPGFDRTVEATLFGVGFRWHSIDWLSFWQFQVGGRWLIQIALGHSGETSHGFTSSILGKRHSFISLGALGFSVDVGKLGVARPRTRVFFNGRRLFYARPGGVEAA